MTLQISAAPRGRTATIFTPASIQKIKEWVAEGISREEIAKSLGVTLGSLQVTCSKLDIRADFTWVESVFPGMV